MNRNEVMTIDEVTQIMHDLQVHVQNTEWDQGRVIHPLDILGMLEDRLYEYLHDRDAARKEDSWTDW